MGNQEGQLPLDSLFQVYTFDKSNTITDTTICLPLLCVRHFKNKYEDFPGGPVVKNPPANVGGIGSIPALERSHMPRSN